MSENSDTTALKAVAKPEYPWTAGIILSGVLLVIIFLYKLYNPIFDVRMIVPFLGMIFFFSVGLWLNVNTQISDNRIQITYSEHPRGISSWAFTVAWILLLIQIIIWIFYKWIS